MTLPGDVSVGFSATHSDSCQIPSGDSLGARGGVVELIWVGTFSRDRRGTQAPQGRRAEIGAPVPVAPNHYKTPKILVDFFTG